MNVKTLAVIGFLPWAVLADKLPEPIFPLGVGINIHFAKDHEKDLEMIAAAGFRFIRMDFFWSNIERRKGEYDWSEYDALTSDLEKHGIRAYYILDYSNPLYEVAATSTNPVTGKVEIQEAPSPQHPESVAAFARWAGAATEHFRGRRVVWEIWNEPNISFWKPKPDVAQYTALALAAFKAIRAADPQACIVAPAAAGFQWDFLETVLKSGALEYLDAVSVHPYRSQPPETTAADFRRLRELIEHCAPHAKRIPILSGEWGYSSNTRGVSQEMQAAFIARQQLSNLLNAVPISIWYDWKNDGEDPAENEHNFGTVGYDLKPKPAYLAIQTLTRELSGYRILQRRDTGNEKDFLLVLTNAAGETKLAAWTVDRPHAVTLDSKWKAAAVIKGNGERSAPKIENGQPVLELDATPEYVSLPLPGPAGKQ